MDMVGLCSICGKPSAMFTCHFCGKLVCRECFDIYTYTCKHCRVGKHV